MTEKSDTPLSSTTAENTPPKGVHWPSAVQFGFSLLAVLGLWGAAMVLFLLGLVELLAPQEGGLGATALIVTAFASTLVGLLLLPSAVFSLGRLIERPIPSPTLLKEFARRVPPVAMLLFAPLVILGAWVSVSERVVWFALPPIHVLAVGLPILWLVWLGRRQLGENSPQRTWGVFGSGLVLGPLLIILLEMAVLGFLGLGGLIFVASNPDVARELTQIAERISINAGDPEAALDLLLPLILRPSTLALVLAFVAVAVPLIEEIFKPIGVWLLAGRGLSAKEGFVAGVLSGAGYALFENLMLSIGEEGWAVTVVARLGTSVMHIFTAGLTGWALALAWREGRYLRLGITYFVSVLIHGLWNGLVVLTGYAMLGGSSETGLQVPGHFVVTGPASLVILAVATLVFFLLANRSFRLAQEEPADALPETLAG